MIRMGRSKRPTTQQQRKGMCVCVCARERRSAHTAEFSCTPFCCCSNDKHFRDNGQMSLLGLLQSLPCIAMKCRGQVRLLHTEQSIIQTHTHLVVDRFVSCERRLRRPSPAPSHLPCGCRGHHPSPPTDNMPESHGTNTLLPLLCPLARRR